MQIPKELLEKWLRLKSQGDLKKIVDANKGLVKGIYDTNLSKALTTGKASDRIFKALQAYYEAKEKELFPQKTDNDGK